MIKQTHNSKNRIKTTEKQTSPSVKPEPKSLVETEPSASKVPPAAPASAPNCESGPRPHLVIKLGIDVHYLDRYVVVRQIDGGTPQPPQRFSPTAFLEWAKKQTALAQQVYSEWIEGVEETSARPEGCLPRCSKGLIRRKPLVKTVAPPSHSTSSSSGMGETEWSR
jgi:hypothetical protein